MSGTSLSAREEWGQGWTVVVAASVGFSFYSIMAAAQGIFMQPLIDEFGWTRAIASSGMTIGAVVMAVLSPGVGALIDRFGTRRLSLVGLALTIAATAMFSLLNGSVTQWLTFWGVYAVVGSVVKSTVWASAVVSRFSTARGLALGLTLSGTAVAQVLVPPIANGLIEATGWRMAFVWLAIGWGGVAMLLCLLFLYDARDLARRAKRAIVSAAQKTAPVAPAGTLPGLTIREAWRDPSLWRIAISTLFMMLLTIALMVHQFPILTEAGVSRGHAALLSSLAGVAGIFGKLITGWLLDRYRANWVGGLTLGASAFAFLLLLDTIASPVIIVIAMFINGYASGTKIQIAGYLTSRYAGMRNFGAIFGTMASVIALGSGLGPLLGGLIHDWYGNYTPLLVIGTVGSILCGWLIFGLRPYPDWSKAPEPATP